MLVSSIDAGRDAEDGTSPYLLAAPRTLRDACRAMGRDGGGRQCPSCGVGELCRRQAAAADRLAASGR